MSVEAQAEARTLMLSSHNILSTKDGKPVAVPSQDMILGTYYLTVVREDTRDKAKTFATYDEVMLAYDLMLSACKIFFISVYLTMAA